MGIKIALVGNGGSGKSTLFNALTGSNQSLKKWHDITLDRKIGRLKRHKSARIVELPDIYSLSPNTMEEVIAREYLIDEEPNVILNVVDGTNLEKSLYLTTQLLELGMPVVVAVNMKDIVEKNGDQINIKELSRKLGCYVTEVCAVKRKGIADTTDMLIEAAQSTRRVLPQHHFSVEVERALTEISMLALKTVNPNRKKYYALKLFERDKKITKKADITERTKDLIDKEVKRAEEKLGLDAVSILNKERYEYISSVVRTCYKKNEEKKKPSFTEKADKIALNRWAAIPVFLFIMFLIYAVTFTAGIFLKNFIDTVIMSESWNFLGMEDMTVPGIAQFFRSWFSDMGSPAWLPSLVIDGGLKSISVVLGFLPTVIIMYILLGYVESSGYLKRTAVIFDVIFKKAGMSGAAVIPLVMGAGDNIMGTLSCDLIKSDRDKKMSVITSSFMPDIAKLPFISMMAAALFDGSPFMVISAYLIGIAAVLISGMFLRKTSLFSGNPVPFALELPDCHKPRWKDVFITARKRCGNFFKKAGLIIFLSSMALWAGSKFGITDGTFGFNADMQFSESILYQIFESFSVVFAPLGFGVPKASAAVFMGIFGKENIALIMTESDFKALAPLGAFCFMVFNLLCMPSIAAIGAVRKEMNNMKWTLLTVAYQCGFAYAVSLAIYQFGSIFMGALQGENAVYHIIGVIISFGLLFFIGLMIFMPYKDAKTLIYTFPKKKQK